MRRDPSSLPSEVAIEGVLCARDRGTPPAILLIREEVPEGCPFFSNEEAKSRRP